MKDLLGQEVSVGDYVVGIRPYYLTLRAYKVCKICPKSIKTHTERQLFPDQMIKITDLSLVPQDLKESSLGDK